MRSQLSRGGAIGCEMPAWFSNSLYFIAVNYYDTQLSGNNVIFKFLSTT